MNLVEFSQRSLYLLALLSHVAANTEIINFSSPRERSVDLPSSIVGNWSTLRPSDNERSWTLELAALHTPLHRACEPNDGDDDSGVVASCPHELWLFLDLDDEKWASHSTFTLRLSWPASIPADFAIVTYTPEHLLAQLAQRLDPNVNRTLDLDLDLNSISSTSRAARGGDTHPHTLSSSLSPLSSSSSSSSTTTRPRIQTTRARYARIRAVDAGVPTPGGLGSRSPRGAPSALFQSQRHHAGVRDARPDRVSSAADQQEHQRKPEEQCQNRTVPFIVILEPTYGGFLPATLLFTVGFLVPILLAAVFLVVPWVTAYVEPFVQQARQDLKAGMTPMSIKVR